MKRIFFVFVFFLVATSYSSEVYLRHRNIGKYSAIQIIRPEITNKYPNIKKTYKKRGFNLFYDKIEIKIDKGGLIERPKTPKISPEWLKERRKR